MTPEEKYRTALEEILLRMEYGNYSALLPPSFIENVAKFLNDRDIIIVHNPEAQALGITTYT